MGGCDVDPANEKRRICNPVIQGGHCLCNPPGRGGEAPQIHTAMGMTGNPAAIEVRDDFPVILRTALGIRQVFHVIADTQHHLVANQPLIHQIKHQQIRHLPDNQPALVLRVRLLQHLPGTEGAALGAVCLDVLHRTRLIAPCVVNEKLCIDAEEPVEQILIEGRCAFPHGAQSHIPHGLHSIGGKPAGIAPAYAPEVRDGAVIPEQLPVAPLVQLCNTHAVSVCAHVLCHNVHGNLAQIQICSDPGSGCDACCTKHIPNHGHGKLVGGHAIGGKVSGDIHKHLVHRVDVNILRGDIV